jgi:plasmid stabilization system protein ParE
MIVRLSPRAIQDLAEIANYVRSHNPSAAQRVRAAILSTLDVLARFPNAGRRQAVQNVRKLVVRRYPYLVYYTVDFSTDEVVIVAIQRAAREREYDDL